MDRLRHDKVVEFIQGLEDLMTGGLISMNKKELHAFQFYGPRLSKCCDHRKRLKGTVVVLDQLKIEAWATSAFGALSKLSPERLGMLAKKR